MVGFCFRMLVLCCGFVLFFLGGLVFICVCVWNCCFSG